MSKRTYSDEEKGTALAALAANGGDVQGTAKKLGLPSMTLRNWAKGQVHPAVTKIGNEQKAALADRLEEIARLAMDLLPSKMNTASAGTLAMVLGISTDKMRLLRDQPTAITQNEHHLTHEERADRILAALGAGGPAEARGPRPDAPGDQPAGGLPN